MRLVGFFLLLLDQKEVIRSKRAIALVLGSDEHVMVRVCRPTGCVELESRYVVIATGSRPNRPKELKGGVTIPYTSRKVVDATQVGEAA